MLIDIVSKSNEFAFYGARVVAYSTYTAIKHLLNRSPICFAVSEMDRNPSAIDGIAVKTVDALPKGILIIITAAEWYQGEINATLKQKGYYNTWVLNSHDEYLLMSQYFESVGKYPVASSRPDITENDFSMFEVRHHLDKPLKNPPTLQAWEISIQAGAKLTESQLCETADHTGNNISTKNKQYCEASVMYWVWKNANASWVGIEHYRRHLLVTPNMLDQNTDVILPLPYICYPNFAQHVSWFVGQEVVEILSSSLKTLYPNDRYAGYLDGVYFYPYNLIVAKKEVFSDYCEWAFKITKYIENLGNKNINDSRALAYIVEQLTSIYFSANNKRLNIKHAEKAIYT